MASTGGRIESQNGELEQTQPATSIAASLPRVLAFFLPQFHPIPENDDAWGPGFTEWTNVARSRPRYRGHYQPHLPADLGFYDLRLREVRLQQEAIARRFMVHGFVYYHYWFHGRRLLQRPVDDLLADPGLTLPFALCWANEAWTRRWDGGDTSVIVPQRYSAEDDADHWRWLLECFADSRYIRVDGRPLFLVYRASQLPDPKRTTDCWRSEATRAGVPDPFLVRVEATGEVKQDPAMSGFDAAVEFQPDFEIAWPRTARQDAWRLMRKVGRKTADRRMPYEDLIARSLQKPQPRYLRFPGVCPSWDNSARARRGASILDGASPDLFEEWVRHTVGRSRHRGEHDLLFVNAWNEWAEGAHLEPDARFGFEWLEALARGVRAGAQARSSIV